MAQMRVKDQDLIVEEVITKIEDNKLQEFKTRKDVQSLQSKIQNRLNAILKLKEQVEKLEQNIKDEKESLNNIVSTFQKDNNLTTDSYGENQGFHLEYSHYNNSVPTSKIVWNLSRKIKRELTTKLRLETMGGDFNAYELIEQLVNEFSN